MKKNSFLLLSLMACASVYAQNRVSVSYNPGLCMSSSENTMRIIGDKRLDWIQGFSIAYVSDNLLSELNLDVEYSYMHSRVADIQDFRYTSEMSAEHLGTFSADLVISWNNIDVDLNKRLSKWLSFSLGPTMSYVGRSIVIDNMPRPLKENGATSFEDRLQSLCVGINGSVNVEIPLEDGDNYLFVLVHSRSRYLHSIWFDKRGRNLDNYYQSFYYGQINIGLGYRF
jgi:hypothetical protein